MEDLMTAAANRYLRRGEAAAHIEAKWGSPCSPKTLAKLAVVGGGPARAHLKLVTPDTENRTVVTPLRKSNAELRTREYPAHRGRKRQPIRTPRRDHDPGGLPPRPARQRTGRP